MPIPEPKIRGLRQLLERDHRVPFKSGSMVEYSDCWRCNGDGRLEAPTKHGIEVGPPRKCPLCEGERVLIAVTRPAGGVSRFRVDELEAVYRLAQDGRPPIPQPKGDPAAYGDAPF